MNYVFLFIIILVNYMREVDLKSIKIRTDLVADILTSSDIDNKNYENIYYEGDIKVSNIKLDDVASNTIYKDVGDYTTIFFKDITDHTNFNALKSVLIKELKKLFINEKITDLKNGLVIGLGNAKSTPDSLGPKVIDLIISTKHIYDITNSLEDGYSIISKIAPGVMGESGIETIDIISGIVERIKPDYLIVIDALASDSVDRVCKTIQLTNTGISPGSGIGNKRKEIKKNTFGIPIIAIGVPTVVDATTIVLDTIDFMMKHFSYNLNNKSSIDKLIPNYMNNYLKVKSIPLKSEEKSFFLGAFGMLSNFEKKALIYDVLTPIGYNLMVTPKEIDFDILNLSKLIGESINEVVHNIK